MTDSVVFSPRLVRVLAGLLISIHIGLLAWAATVHAPTMDEPAHLAAGIRHWQFGRFDLYRVTPPLVRLVAALPVLAAGVQTDWDHLYEYAGSRPDIYVGNDLLRANGERFFTLMILARWACIPFSVLGAYVCYRWAKQLSGPVAGLLALALWCFCPNILAHAELITTDAAAAALFVTASYAFWCWLHRPDWLAACAAGLALGLVQLTKATFLILYPLWPIIWVIWKWGDRRAIRSRPWLLEGAQLLLAMSLSLWVLNAGYGFEGSLKRLSDYTFVSRNLAGAESPGNRFAGSRLGSFPVPIPEHYLRGNDIQKRYFEAKLHSYLRGEWKRGGWWYYYIYGLAIKVPIGTWILITLAAVWTLWGRRAKPRWRDDLSVLLPLLTVLFLVSSQTGFSKNLRYVLPIFPLAFVWISRIAEREALAKRSILTPAVVGLLWSVASSLSVYPHNLSYFNEFVGGPLRGHEHLIHTNIDWGQDLLLLKRWQDDHPEAKPICLAYYGSVDPQQAGIEYIVSPFVETASNSRCSSNSSSQRLEPPPGWYAISVNLLRGAQWRIPDGRGGTKPVAGDNFACFLRMSPISTAGYSIYIYHIPSIKEDTARIHPEAEAAGLP